MPSNDVVTTEPEGDRYVENPDFVPDPTHQFGTLDTSGTAGAAHSRIEEVTPIFDIADQENAKQAARALDPDDDEVDSSLVVMPQGTPMTVVDEDAIKGRVAKRAEQAKPVRVFGPTMAQKQAAESGEEGEEIAQAQQESTGAGSTATGDPEGAERQSGGERAERTTGDEGKEEPKEEPAKTGRGRSGQQ